MGKYIVEGGCRSDEDQGLPNLKVVCVVNALTRWRWQDVEKRVSEVGLDNVRSVSEVSLIRKR